jgi:hypothetical protein
MQKQRICTPLSSGGLPLDDVRAASQNVGKAIVKAMTGIEKANRTLCLVYSAALMMQPGQIRIN